MLDYAQVHIFDAVTTCGRYQGRLLLILILHNVMHDITSTLPVGVNHPQGGSAKCPPHVNRRRAPGAIWLRFTGYCITTILYAPAGATNSLAYHVVSMASQTADISGSRSCSLDFERYITCFDKFTVMFVHM